MDTSYFYKDKPLFGLDIGYGSLKVMQINHAHGKNNWTVTGYGAANFNPEWLKDGVITKPEELAKVINSLFADDISGHITTRRVAVTVPVARTFNRAMVLPKVASKELDSVVRLEAEQYIPVPLDDLYLDYEVNGNQESETLLLAVAVPKVIVDSYMNLFQIIGLEPIIIETTIASASRLVAEAEQNDVPMVLIDLGSLSIDISIFDKSLIVTGTVPGGGDEFTQSIASKLGVNAKEAHTIKTKYGMGLSKKQAEIAEALEPQLSGLVREVRRMIRYYEERATEGSKIGQIVTLGGGANMPGLSDYLTNSLRLPVRMCHPWDNLTFGKLTPPNATERSIYITVAGLALTNPKEVF